MRILIRDYNQAVHDRDDPALGELRPYHQTVVILFRLLPIACVYSFWVMLVRDASDLTLNRDQLFYTACQIAFVTALIGGILCFFAMAKLERAGRSRIIPAVYATAALMVFTTGFIMHLHYKVAMGPKYKIQRAVLHQEIVRDKNAKGNERSARYFVWFAGLKNSGKTARLDVSKKFYDNIKEGEVLTLEMRPRLLGYDTVEEATK